MLNLSTIIGPLNSLGSQLIHLKSTKSQDFCTVILLTEARQFFRKIFKSIPFMFLFFYFEPLLGLSNNPGFMHWQLKIFGCSHFSRGIFFGISDAVVRVRTFFRHTTFVHRFIVIFLLKRVSSCILTIKNPFPNGCSVLSLFRFDPLVFDKNSKLLKV